MTTLINKQKITIISFNKGQNWNSRRRYK